MGIFDDGFIFNHIQKEAFYYYRAENRLPEVESLLKQPIDNEELIYTPTESKHQKKILLKKRLKKPKNTSLQETFSKLSSQNVTNFK